jgi:hypothetical protein
MQAPSGRNKNRKSYIDKLQIIETTVLDQQKDALITILTNYISNNINKQTTITNLEKLSIAINTVSNTR